MPPRRGFRKVPDDALVAAAASAENMRQLLQAVGLAAYGGNYESVRVRLERLDALPPHLQARRQRSPAPWVLSASDEELAAAVRASVTKAGVLRRLGHEPDPRMYRDLDRRLAAAAIPTGHMKGRAWGRGVPRGPRVPLEQVLVPASVVGTHELRLRLLREGVFAHECACCDNSGWQGAPIPLELDHIDGDRTNNALGNLRLLCPNCHAQTATYRGRNVGRAFAAAPLPHHRQADDRAGERLRRIFGAA